MNNIGYVIGSVHHKQNKTRYVDKRDVLINIFLKS